MLRQEFFPHSFLLKDGKKLTFSLATYFVRPFCGSLSFSLFLLFTAIEIAIRTMENKAVKCQKMWTNSSKSVVVIMVVNNRLLNLQHWVTTKNLCKSKFYFQLKFVPMKIHLHKMLSFTARTFVICCCQDMVFCMFDGIFCLDHRPIIRKLFNWYDYLNRCRWWRLWLNCLEADATIRVERGKGLTSLFVRSFIHSPNTQLIKL